MLQPGSVPLWTARPWGPALFAMPETNVSGVLSPTTRTPVEGAGAAATTAGLVLGAGGAAAAATVLGTAVAAATAAAVAMTPAGAANRALHPLNRARRMGRSTRK